MKNEYDNMPRWFVYMYLYMFILLGIGCMGMGCNLIVAETEMVVKLIGAAITLIGIVFWAKHLVDLWLYSDNIN